MAETYDPGSPFATILEDIQNKTLDREQRLIVARGFLPLEPDVLAPALLFLTEDEDEEVRETARSTILEMPVNIVKTIARDKLISPKILDLLARIRIGDEELLETILFNPATADGTFEFIASNGPSKIIEILSGNQERMLRNPRLMERILKNKNTSPYVRMQLELYQQEIREQKAAREEAAAILAESVLEKKPPVAARPVQEAVREPEKPKPEPQQPVKPVFTAKPVKESPSSPRPAKPAADESVENEEKIDLYEEAEQPPVDTAHDGGSIAHKISTMNVADKIKLATLGTREERFLLMRETNRLVAMAALKSPKTTEEEIEQIAKMKNVIEDVLRDIGTAREFIQSPSIRKALLENPRCPIGVSLNLLKFVSEKELNGLSKNRNIPEAIRTAARRMILQKEQRKAQKKGH